MDFTVEPLEDVLEREHQKFLEQRTQRQPKKMSADTLARLAAPRKQRRFKSAKGGDADVTVVAPAEKKITNNDDGWGDWADAIDVSGQAATADAEALAASPVSPTHGPGSSPPRTAAAAAPAGAGAADVAHSPKKERAPVKRVTGRGLAHDMYYVVIQGAGREAAFCLDRKTMFAASLEACGFPQGGTLVYRNLPVHNHATASTLGLRQGPEHVTLLLFMTGTELTEEADRARIAAEEIAVRGNCIAALACAIEDSRRPQLRRHFEDADGPAQFVDADPM